MKLPSDAWNQPEGVSEATWLAYLLLCQDKLTTMVQASRSYGLQITDSVVLEQHSRALTDLKEKKPQGIATGEFDKELKLLEAQIRENEKISKSAAGSIEKYRTQQELNAQRARQQEERFRELLKLISSVPDSKDQNNHTGPKL